MAIIHVNPYDGFTRQKTIRVMDIILRTQTIPLREDMFYLFGIMTLNLSISSSYNHVNYDLMHVGSIPSYKDVVGAGSTTDYRRVRAYLSPTGSPYMYDSGDIDGEIKPFKYYFSWNQGDYGHNSNIRIGGTSTNRSKSNMISLGEHMRVHLDWDSSTSASTTNLSSLDDGVIL